MEIPSGTYTITNVYHASRVCLPNDDDRQSVVSSGPPAKEHLAAEQVY